MDRTVELDAVLNALTCGAIALAEDKRILAVNDEAARLIGRPPVEMTGTPLRELVGPAMADRLCAAAKASTTSAVGAPLEWKLDGAARSLIVNFRPLQLREGAVTLLTLLDVTAQHEHEQKLKSQYKEVTRLGDVLIQQALALKRHAGELEVRVRERTQELHEANTAAIYMLAVASEARDEETGAHIRRIERYSRTLAKALELPAAEVEEIAQSSILHDVGKVQIPDEILHKPGPLTATERAAMEAHTTVGEGILSTKPFFDTARRIARHHHERWDGKGYPDRLAQESIPLAARIVHIVDVYDALRSKRVYKPAWPMEKVRAELMAEAGKSFDPRLVRVFEGLLSQGELK